MPNPIPDDRDLLYAIDETQCLVFAPRDIVCDLLAARERLPSCKSWGEARLALSEPLFLELADRLIAPVDQPPADDLPLDPGEATDGGQWPCLSYSQMTNSLPQDVVEAVGDRYDTMMSSGYNLPLDRADELIGRLRAVGYRCEEDARLPDLFNPWE